MIGESLDEAAAAWWAALNQQQEDPQPCGREVLDCSISPIRFVCLLTNGHPTAHKAAGHTWIDPEGDE